MVGFVVCRMFGCGDEGGTHWQGFFNENCQKANFVMQPAGCLVSDEKFAVKESLKDKIAGPPRKLQALGNFCRFVEQSAKKNLGSGSLTKNGGNRGERGKRGGSGGKRGDKGGKRGKTGWRGFAQFSHPNAILSLFVHFLRFIVILCQCSCFWTVWRWFSPVWLFGRQKQCFVGSQLGLTFLRSINFIWLVFWGCSAEKP